MTRLLFEYHPSFGYRFIPGLKTRVPHESGGYLVRVNSDGFRCEHEFIPAKSPGLRRALLFGDSFTAGDGVSNVQRFGDRLESLVGDLEVFNFGLPSAGPDQSYLVYQEYAPKLDHDLMIIAVLAENIRRVAAAYRLFINEQGQEMVYAKPYYEIVHGEFVLRHVPAPKKPIAEADMTDDQKAMLDRGGRMQVVRELVGKLGLREIAQRVTRYQPLPEYDDPQHPAWLLMRRLLTEWISRHPKPVLLVPLPLYQHVEETCDAEAFSQRFRELAQETGCYLHDPLRDLQAYCSEERRSFRFGRDVHLTASGHAALAASLAPAVREILAKQGTSN